MGNKERQKNRWVKLKEKGICTSCGKNKPVESKIRCENCLKIIRRYQKESIYKRKSLGLCIRCGKYDAVKGLLRCEECLENDKKKYHLNKFKNNHIISRINYNYKIYGITIEKYNEMFEKQKGLCAICGRAPFEKRNGKIKRFAVDHNHETGEFRGLLCSNCNTAIGQLREKKELFLNAMKYLGHI